MADKADTTKSGPDVAAPYMPFKTFTNVLVKLQEEGLPRRLDSGYLSNMSGGTRSQLIAGMKWLGLIDGDDRPQATLTGLAQAGEARPAAIRDLWERHYAWALALVPENGTQNDLDEAFRRHGVSGSTLRKATAFFLQGAAYAGIPVSPFFRQTRAEGGTPRRRTTGTRKPKPKANPPSGGPVERTPPPAPVVGDPAEQRRQALFDVLLKKLDSADSYDEALVDRLERIAGTLPPKPEG